MTNAQFKKKLAAQIKMVTPDIQDAGDIVEAAISLGISDVWYAFPWHFTCREFSLTVDSTAESYELPRDLGAVLSVREVDSLRDRAPAYFPKEEFDFRVPRTDVVTTGSPDIYTLFHNNGRFYISFVPRPEPSTEFKIYAQTRPPEDIDGVAPEAHAAVDAAVQKHMFPVGSNEYGAAHYMYRKEIEQLQRIDRLNRPALTQMYVDNTENIGVFRPWAGEY